MKKMLLLFLAAAAVSAAAAELSADPAKPAAQVVIPAGLKSGLPEVIYAVPGMECNIYFENVVDTAALQNYAVEVRCTRGAQGEKRWYWTPAPADAGKSFELELRLFNDNGMVLSSKCTVSVAAPAADPKQKFTLALLADSGIGCDYPQHMLNVMREKGFENYTPIGSHDGRGNPVPPGGAAHDGYGGYTWGCFLNRWKYSEEELPDAQTKAEAEQMRSLGVVKIPKSRAFLMRSPLLRLVNGKPQPDIPAWLQKINQGKAPDYIVVQLGGNDIFSARPEQMDERIVSVMENARRLLAMLRKYAPDAVIGVATCPFGCGQDGFAVNYGCRQSRYQYRRNAHRYNREIAGLVKSLGDARISIVPLHHALDSENSYITSTVKAHERSSRKVVRFRNALHPAKEGGYQMGDAMAAWLIHQRSR